jgi:hypothetical protein
MTPSFNGQPGGDQSADNDDAEKNSLVIIGRGVV